MLRSFRQLILVDVISRPFCFLFSDHGGSCRRGLGDRWPTYTVPVSVSWTGLVLIHKNCGPDSRAAMARFHGTKLRLMTWAEAVAFGKAD